MSDTEPQRWRRTSPLAAVYFLGKLYQAIAQNAVQSLAPLAAFLVAYQGDIASKAILGGTGFVLVTVSAAVLRFWFFRFQVGEESILIRDGVIKKTQLDIKFDRIQAMNTEQTLLFRFFGLTTVRFDTAGSSQQEGALPGINLELAKSLEEKLGKQRELRHSDPDLATDEATETAPPLRTVLRLGIGDVVRTGLSSSRSLIFLAILAPLLNNLDERIEENIDQNQLANAAIQAGELGVAQGASLVLLIIFAVVAFLMLVSIAGAFLRYHKFVLQTDGDQLRSTGGLLTRHEHAMQIGKIQSLHLTQNLAHRLFGRFRLHAKQAASGKISTRKSFSIPLVKPGALPGLTSLGFGDEFGSAQIDPGAAGFRRVSKQYVRSRTVLAGLLPALLAVALFAVPMGWYSLLFLLWVPVAAIYVYQRYRRLGVSVTRNGIAFRQGLVGNRVVAHLMRKVQRVNVSQSPFQRRKNLATIKLFLASGTVRIPFISAADAHALRDYILYKIESSDRAWH